jgi:hypothetical protein
VLVAALYLAPVIWNDQPLHHNLIKITGIPFL